MEQLKALKSFTPGDKENLVTKHAQVLEAKQQLDDVVAEKDEQLVVLNKMLCDLMAERDAAVREAEALRQLTSVNEQLRSENSRLMTQVHDLEEQVEELNTELAAREQERPPSEAPSGPPPSIPHSFYVASPAKPPRREVIARPMSLASHRSTHHLTAADRARLHDTMTRAMLLKKW